MGIEICKYGHFSERGAQNKCLQCSRQRAEIRRTNNPEHVKKLGRALYAANREQRTEDGRRYYHANVKKSMIRHAHRRAQKGGYACTIVEADLQIPEFCPLLSIKIQAGGKLNPASPSLDKIIPELGYVPGNVWIISHRANQIKSDATVAELELLVANLKIRCTVDVRQELIVPWVIVPPATIQRMPWE